MLPTKLTLSAEERLLMMDTRFILTKNAVLEKVEALFGVLSENTRGWVTASDLQQSPIFLLSPKIARGEQYQQLPWLMLDYPRLFTKTDSCAIRCFFWWGNYWSITLQLAGSYLHTYQAAVETFINDRKDEENWYLSVGDDPWQHGLDTDAYIPARRADNSYWERSHQFLKLAKKIPLDQWENIFPILENNMIALLSILKKHQAPSR